MGGTVADLTAAASVPGFLSGLIGANEVQAFALANYGADFNSLSQPRQLEVVETYTRYGTVGQATDLTSGSSGTASGVSSGAANAAEATSLSVQQKVGQAFSSAIVSGQRGTETVVNWLGESNATTAGMALMVALGGPVKTALGMAVSASPVGQGIDAAKGQVTAWLTPINGTYLFGADSDAAQQLVYPASHAVAGTTTELGSSLLSTSMAASVKGIIGLSKGSGIR